MKNITCFNLSFLVKFFLIFIYICVHSSCSQKNFNYANASNHSKIKADASIHKKINDFSSKINEKKNKPNNTNDIILGLKAFANKNFEEANFYFQHAIKFDPQNPYLHKLNAMSYHLRGDLGDPDQYELALVGYELAGRMDPGDSSIPYFQGIINYAMSRYRKSQDFFAKAIMTNDREYTYYLGLAASSYYLGEIDRAYINAKKAYELNPKNINTLQAKGIIAASFGSIDDANHSLNQVAMYTDSSKDLRLDFIKKRIDDWSSYYRSPRIKSDKKLQMLLAQDLDVYGIPEDGDLDSTNGSASNFSDDSSNNSNIQNTSDSSNTTVNSPKKNLKKKINTPKMALVDVAIIRTEEIYKSSKGVNLLNGLNLFFSGDDSFFIGQTFGKDNRVANTNNDQFTIKLGTNAAGLNYSLNIFNDNYDRNEVIARPTILVQDNQKSSFFSGGTMHIVLEGGVAGSGSIEPIDVGVTLEVKPKFLDSETININVLAQRTFLETALSGVNDSLTGTSFAQTSKTKIQANLTLRYGETMVLSGLSDQEKENIDDKVPLVGDLPVIQYLFRNNTKLSSKRTVLILLTPRQATLSYEDGESMNPEADVKTTNLTKLEGDSWMKPSPNLKGIVSHLSKYDFFNQFRKGDIMVENWAGEGTIYDVINRTLEYFYIRYGFAKNSTAQL